MKKEYVFRLALVSVIAFLIFQFGIKPVFLNTDTYANWASGKLPYSNGIYDVIVLGESPEGIAAATSAARAGAKTLLIASGDDFGGDVKKCLITSLDPNIDKNNNLLEKGMFQKLYNRVGSNFSIKKYINTVTDFVKKQANLDYIYSTLYKAPILAGNTLTGIKIITNNKEKEFYSNRFIDATSDGVLLNSCNVPYFKGSEDINMKESYLPVRLNFEVEGLNYNVLMKAIRSSTNSNKLYNNGIYSKIYEYETANVNISLHDLSFCNQGSGKVIIEGIEVKNLNVFDSKAVSEAYKAAVKEATNLTSFIGKVLDKMYPGRFRGIKLCNAADSFVIKESKHYIGEHTLSVNEVLNNTDFSDKIAVGAYPIDASKLSDNGSYIIGYPDLFSIPLGCVVPLKIENLLMVGSKASYSSLAATSAGTISMNMAVGESAGTAAVFTIVKKLTPRELLLGENKSKVKELQSLLNKQGIYLPSFKISNKNSKSWSYPQIEKLCSLGLIAGGIGNNFSLNNKAKAEDLSILLLNGVYRIYPEKYSLRVDYALRKNFNSNKLTRNEAGKILADLYGVKTSLEDAYNFACQKGYIDSKIQRRLKKRDILKIDEVIYLAAYNISKFTGRNF